MGSTWYACSEPERPNDPYVRWHWADCLGCRVKAHATLLRHPDDATAARVLGPLAQDMHAEADR